MGVSPNRGCSCCCGECAIHAGQVLLRLLADVRQVEEVLEGGWIVVCIVTVLRLCAACIGALRAKVHC